jgi:hypothetical protein
MLTLGNYPEFKTRKLEEVVVDFNAEWGVPTVDTRARFPCA